jgi:hypothetical protein
LGSKQLKRTSFCQKIKGYYSHFRRITVIDESTYVCVCVLAKAYFQFK